MVSIISCTSDSPGSMDALRSCSVWPCRPNPVPGPLLCRDIEEERTRRSLRKRSSATKAHEMTTLYCKDKDAVSSPKRAISAPGSADPCKTTRTSMSDSAVASPRACEP